jgi:hypothetical protein
LGLPLTICTIYNGCFPDAEDLDHCKLAVLNSLGSSACAALRRVYEYAINQFITWYCSEPPNPDWP